MNMQQASVSQRVVRFMDETTPLIRPPEGIDADVEDIPTHLNAAEHQLGSKIGADELDGKSVVGVIAVLLIGVFVSQADVCLVLATYGQISSEFHALQDGDWLLSSYLLAQCVAQPLYGKLSDIFSRKRCLQASYAFFAVGTVISGLGQSLGQVIAGRAIEGIGGAGMVCMVSILLTDLVPLHKVAVYRSYVNMVQTAGRSCGGVIGGYLAQTVGWRWAFLGQAPLVIIAILLVQWRLQLIAPPSSKQSNEDQNTVNKIKRVDFLGAALMSLVILSALFILDMGGQKVPWNHPLIFISATATVLCSASFLIVERYVASEPIFPLRLISHYVVITSYMMLCLQNLAVTALILVVPMYFQVTKLATTGEAGAYLVPSVVGNTIGGLATGAWIQRSRRYKLPQIIGSFCSLIAFACIALLWQGNTGFAGLLLILPVGLATGIAHSAIFIGLGAGVEESDIAIAGSGLYLSANVGMVAGVSLGNAIYQSTLRKGLYEALEGNLNRKKIISRALEDISFIKEVSAELRQTMIGAYVSSFRGVFLLGVICSALALVVGLLSREKKLGSR